MSEKTININAPELVNDDDLLLLTVYRDGAEFKFNEEIGELEDFDRKRLIARACHITGTRFIYEGGEKLLKKSTGYNVPSGHKSKPLQPIFTIVWRGESIDSANIRIIPQLGAERMNRGEWDIKIGQALEHTAYNYLVELLDSIEFMEVEE